MEFSSAYFCSSGDLPSGTFLRKLLSMADGKVLIL